MARPHLIRADTIDLQDPASPSAKDHTRQPTHPAAIGVGPPAPHQAETLREVAAEELEELHRTPRPSDEWSNEDEEGSQHNELRADISGVSLTDMNLEQQNASTLTQNGGHKGPSPEDGDMADAEGDDGLDEDDLMDKISSSPSIEDGGCSLPLLWPERQDSLSVAENSKRSPSHCQPVGEPYVQTLMHHPVKLQALHIDGKRSQSEVPDYFFRFEYHEPTGSSVGDISSIEDDERLNNLTSIQDDKRDGFIENYDCDFEACAIDDLLEVQGEFDLEYSCDASVDEEAMMTIPYESSEEDEDDDFPHTVDSRFIDSGWGGECLQETEDIDFDFVYALHTFVATVEGQANATKGDTMVLLDDSNSYWWLVRVVKDASIGYLPAEHIETPTERLARLNKHRNIDLSATMLGDNIEKTKNPLKKAIRRRNAKTVTFSAPTYVEASDIDYSSDEDGVEVALFAQDLNEPEPKSKTEDDEKSTEPVSEKGPVRDVTVTDDVLGGATDSIVKAGVEGPRTSDEILESKPEGMRQTRNGTVRNTDSFFKDDSVETRKITITPNLLRDDSSTSTRTLNDSKDPRQRSTLDKADKEATSDKIKEDRKKKDKKHGMLSGLFKRKDKKSRNVQEEDIDEIIYGKKTSTDEARASPVSSKDSEESPTTEDSRSVNALHSSQKQPSKLQKPLRGDNQARPISTVTESILEPQLIAAPDRSPPAIGTSDQSVLLVQSLDQQSKASSLELQSRVRTPEAARPSSASGSNSESQKSGGTLTKIPRSRSGSSSESKPEMVKKAKERLELDDSDTPVEVSPAKEISDEIASHITQKSMPGTFSDSHTPPHGTQERNAVERLSESPVHVSPVDTSRSNPPALMVDSSSQEEVPSPSYSPSPVLIDVDEIHGKKESEIGSSTPTSTSTWSDAHLRTFFEDDSDIRDLLVVVYDKSGVVPAGPDHPVTGSLFKAENARLAEITSRLDGMLGDWLARKAKSA